MYNFFADLIIWTFAIYGFISFLNEFILEIIYYIVRIVIAMMMLFKKFIAKFSR